MKKRNPIRKIQLSFFWGFLLILCAGASEALAFGPCVPASLLATDPDFSNLEIRIIELARVAERLEDGSGLEADKDAILTHLDEQGALGAEARCWSTRLKLVNDDAQKTWSDLGSLRMTHGGLVLFRELSKLEDGLSLILRSPEIGAWPIWARASLEEWLDIHRPTSRIISEQYEDLLLASARWPSSLRVWLEGAKIRDLRKPEYSVMIGNLGIDLHANDLANTQPQYVLPLLIPGKGRFRHVGTQLENFLRFVATQYEVPLWVQPIFEEEDVQERINELMSAGSEIFAVMGPVVRRDTELSFSDQAMVPLWFGFQSKPPLESVENWLSLRPTLASLLESHAKGLEEETQVPGLPGPVYVLGRPGKVLEQWTEEALKLWPEGEITALSYEYKDHDLSEYASMVASAKPGTVILAAPKADVGNLLRFLARAGLWARRPGKSIEVGEHHPYILGPSWFLQDPKLVRLNRFYLDGVRVVSDLPPLSEWLKEPLVAQFKSGYGIPPLIGLRAAALLVRLAALLKEGPFNPPMGTEWLQGQTPWGQLHQTKSSLTFELQRYIFAGQKFRRQTSSEP